MKPFTKNNKQVQKVNKAMHLFELYGKEADHFKTLAIQAETIEKVKFYWNLYRHNSALSLRANILYYKLLIPNI